MRRKARRSRLVARARSLRRSRLGELAWRTRRKLRFLLRDPVTLNEKIQYRMVFDRRPILTQFVDKYAMREFVERRIGDGHLPTLYGVAEAVHDIDWEGLPTRFALKATHGCGATILVDDRADPDIGLPDVDPRRPWGVTVRVHPRHVIGTEHCESLINAWLSSNYWRYHGITEWAYKNVPPRIIFEELLDPGDGSTPLDHKLWCFNGEVVFLTVDDRNGTKRRSVHLADWTHVPGAGIAMQDLGVVSSEDVPMKPQNLERLTAIAKRLADGMDFVRVDLYNVKQRIVVGELTVYPTGGAGHYSPPRLFDELAEPWNPSDARRAA